MKKIKCRQILLFLAAAALMFLGSAFKEQNETERYFERITLAQDKTIDYTIDVAKFGPLKYWLNPNVMTLYLRCQTPPEADGLSCRSEGLDIFLSQGSKKGLWRQLSPQDKLLQRRGSLPLSLEIAVPRQNIRQREAGSGKIEFFREGKPYAAVNIRIVNSKF